MLGRHSLCPDVIFSKYFPQISTLTFIKEYTVDTLPETGAPIGSGAVAGLGMLLTSAGVVLAKKRK